jgi:hypothetical protein
VAVTKLTPLAATSLADGGPTLSRTTRMIFIELFGSPLEACNDQSFHFGHSDKSFG